LLKIFIVIVRTRMHLEPQGRALAMWNT